MLEQHSYTDINAETWDQWARDGIAWSIPVSHEVFQRAQAGQWDVILTASRPVPHSWFGELAGKRVLGLASGGGQQIPILCARGAVCTVLDYSLEQLARERLVAQREGYAVEIIRGDMTQPLPFADESFDLVFHPVSNCYVEDVQHVWDECFRVLRPGGRLLAGMDNGLNFLFDDVGTLPLTVSNPLPFNPLRGSRAELERMVAQGEGVQFSHSLEEQLGGQLKAGFLLRDLFEDRDPEGSGLLRDFAPQYIATLAEKPAAPGPGMGK